MLTGPFSGVLQRNDQGMREPPAGVPGGQTGFLFCSLPLPQVVKEIDMTRIAIASEGPTLDDLVDPSFGRAAGFVVVDIESMETRYIDNGQAQVMSEGAGIQAAQLMVGAGVSCVLSVFVGPKAFQALSAAQIRVVENLRGCKTVRQAVERFKRGAVQFADGPNKGPGWL